MISVEEITSLNPINNRVNDNSVADPRFPRRGTPTLKVGYQTIIFSQKLHKTEKNGRRGSRPWHPPKIGQNNSQILHIASSGGQAEGMERKISVQKVTIFNFPVRGYCFDIF